VALFGCPAYPDLNVNFTLNPNCSVDQLLLIDTAGQRYIEFIIELEDDKPEAETGKKIEALKNERSFVNDVAAMQTDATFSDATLECDGEVLQCHRFILAARSEHFKNMLAQQGFKEGCLKRIEVKDMAVNTLREMINYIYSGRFDEKTDVSALFSAAHLYAIPGLVSECEAIMIKTLTVENAAEFFFKAFLTEKTGLKSAAMSLISKKFVDVKKTEGWADFMKNKSSSLALEQILRFMASGEK